MDTTILQGISWGLYSDNGKEKWKSLYHKKENIGGLYRITPILYRVVLMESSCAPYGKDAERSTISRSPKYSRSGSGGFTSCLWLA